MEDSDGKWMVQALFLPGIPDVMSVENNTEVEAHDVATEPA